MSVYKEFSDQDLTRLLKTGDGAALTEIHARYYSILYMHAYKRFPYREEVRDILQELFTYLWDHKYEIELHLGLPAYLYASVRNRILNLHRNQKVRGKYSKSMQAFIEQGTSITDEQLREKELRALIDKEIAALPPQMRIIFELSRNQELSHSEIADKLDLSPLTVRTQVRNALRILRGKLGPYVFFIWF
ncbi:RNA polymerase sigma-70 factor [Pedobacter sp. HMWF019]|uniref:RNA polymerase sigma-70 factor n=1 Tax=Pedobacter sp. HMWF019 TaxID=2056856 RepID=UPI000D3386F0|nr:RNA polymerase sigma-70 factor [Pedobacter sp. HMWF019]PTT00942.1 RNA polymerase sigma-70 factor [Pedobacter sp. HMWF019]